MNTPLPVATNAQIAHDTWVAAVRPAFEHRAAQPGEWTTWDVTREYRLPEPPDPTHHWGGLMTVLLHEGVIEPTGWTPTRRTGSRAPVRTWRGTTTHTTRRRKKTT
ncbi:hypothetical protein GCM10027160_23980 [Streptomyces calidiresistens]